MHVEKKFMEAYYNMLSKKITLWGGGALVKDLTLQCEGPHTCNLGYQGYLSDLIK
jgi:hypothetical protein